MSADDAKKPGPTNVTPVGGSRKVIITTFGSVVNSGEAIIRLSQQPVSLRTAQRILKLKHKIDELGMDFFERRDAIAAEKGTPIGNKKWKLETAQKEEYQTAVEMLIMQEVQIPMDICITLADLSEARISAADLERLAFLVEDMA